MRKTELLALIAVFSLAAVACGGDETTPNAGGTTPAGGTSPQPTANTTPLTNQGTMDATATGAFSIELDDNYFKPTFIKARPGQTLNIELESEGSNLHTFTITALNIDQELAAGEKKEVDITLPSGTTDVAFFCRFHGADGMRGAFFFGASPGASTSTADDEQPNPY